MATYTIFAGVNGAGKTSIYESICHEYKGVTNEWLEFILMNRKDINSKSPYDITIGEVADDQVFATINLLARGLIDINAATQRLKFKLPDNQVCINNQEVIERCLKYIGMEVVK